MNLQEKVKLTREIFKRILSFAQHKNIYVAWTGGKDSTVTLYLWVRFLEEKGFIGKPGAINLDTGLKFPEIISFRDQIAGRWAIDLHVMKPDIDITGYAVAKDKVACCRDLKVKPLKQAVQEQRVEVLITGIRKDEHPARGNREEVEEKSDPSYLQANPILHWTEMDIWSYIIQQNLPYCDLYEQGYTSLGCMPCTRRATGEGERSGRAGEKEESLDVLRSLGYF